MLKEKILYSRRLWLRPATHTYSSTSMTANVTLSKFGNEKKYDIDSSIEIRGCSNSRVSLEFSAYNKASALRELKTIEKLRDEIDVLAAAYADAIEEAYEK